LVVLTTIGLAKEAQASEPDGHCPTLTHLTGLHKGFSRYHVNEILGSRGTRLEYRVIPASGRMPETKQEVRSYTNCLGFSWEFVFTRVPHDSWRLNFKVD
jgi:hypothetical protein